MTSSRLARGLSICGAVLLGAMLPAVASAKDYPVPPNSGQGFADALQQAAGNPGPDRILLGGGYYTAPNSTGFNYTSLSDPLEIAGTGREGPGATIINAPSGGSQTLWLGGGSGSSIHDVRIELPIGAQAGAGGLQTSGTARHITVFAKDTQQSNFRDGVVLNGGKLEDSIVDVGMKLSAGVNLADGAAPSTIRGSVVTANEPVASSYGGLIERSRLIGGVYGLQAWRNLTTVRSTLIETQLPQARGVWAYTSQGYNTNVVLDGVDLIGPGGADTRGVWTASNYQGTTATAAVRNSILRGFSVSLYVQSDSTVKASYSDYDGSGNFGNAGITESNISNVGSAGFAGPGDYHLVKGSPLVDAGDPAAAQGLDLAGIPLVADGNGDGTARRDIGAYELPGPAAVQQPPGGGEPGADTTAPALSGFASTRKSFTKRTRFRFTLSEAARVTIRIQRATGTGARTRYRTVATIGRSGASGRNSTAFSRKVGRRLLHAGRYRAVARATDSAGNRSAPRRAAFRIAR
ncbi:MAG TPA: choice-of-anchor Q domain-containing protein [Thermoleophilaceae bacterium]